MRDEKEERKKQARANKLTRQSNTAHPRQYMYTRIWANIIIKPYLEHNITHYGNMYRLQVLHYVKIQYFSIILLASETSITDA